ncbi:integral membrane protein DUF106-domain-containing protein [Blastocladiella britannica]|nr:integral membrane protein DUF106-domain-containing protein [Blastocladiella britannica]
MTYYDGLDPVIVLTPAIRNWVLFPIMLVMLLIGLLRHYLTLLFATAPNARKAPLMPAAPGAPPVDEAAQQRQLNSVIRSVTLRRHAAHLPPDRVAARRAFWMQAFKDRTYLVPKVEVVKKQSDDEDPPLPDMGAMDSVMGPLKQNIAMIVPQTIIMAFINAFFSGFLLIKLPFPLTVRFKSMLQSGIMTPDLDAAWVSSLSWYFLNLFGLNPIFRLILGQGNAADGSAALTAMNPMAAAASASAAPAAGAAPGGAGGGVGADVQMPEIPNSAPNPLAGLMGNMPGADPTAAWERCFESEREFLMLMEAPASAWVGEGVEQRVLELLLSQ